MCSDLWMEVPLSHFEDHKLPLCTWKWVTQVLEYPSFQTFLRFLAPTLCSLKKDIALSINFDLKILIRVCIIDKKLIR